MAEIFFRSLLTYSDETHRLNEKAGMFHNKGENQIKEIILASGCSVIFLDESQRVTMDDIGSVDEKLLEFKGLNLIEELLHVL